MTTGNRVMWALCLFLAAEWIWFGLMHFTLHDETIAQMPPFIPFKSALATLTGVWEVATGFALLVPHWRRAAALSSLLLLLAISPAIVHITLNPDPSMAPPAMAAYFPYVVLPNAVVMAVASWWVWRRAA